MMPATTSCRHTPEIAVLDCLRHRLHHRCHPRPPGAQRVRRMAAALVGLVLLACQQAAAQSGGAFGGASGGAVRGRVVLEGTGRPLTAATVAIGNASVGVRTDSLGQFVLRDVAPGPHVLTVQAVGYAVFRQSLVLRAGESVDVEVVLTALSNVLDTVRTNAAPTVLRDMNLVEFDDRRTMGLGRFLTAEDMDARPGSSLAGILRTKVPGLTVVRYGSNTALASSRGATSKTQLPAGDDFDRAQGAPPRCYVQILVDNLSRYGSGQTESLYNIDNIDPTSVSAVEYYTVSQTPPQFNRRGNAACGTLVIWLKQ